MAKKEFLPEDLMDKLHKVAAEIDKRELPGSLVSLTSEQTDMVKMILKAELLGGAYFGYSHDKDKREVNENVELYETWISPFVFMLCCIGLLLFTKEYTGHIDSTLLMMVISAIILFSIVPLVINLVRYIKSRKNSSI